MSLELYGLHDPRIHSTTIARSDEWAAKSMFPFDCRYSRVEVLETIAVLSECDPGIEVGWEAGSRSKSDLPPSSILCQDLLILPTRMSLALSVSTGPFVQESVLPDR